MRLISALRYTAWILCLPIQVAWAMGSAPSLPEYVQGSINPIVAPGFYEVHRVYNDGRIEPVVGAYPLGSLVHVHNETQVQKGRAVTGIHAVFLNGGSGSINSILRSDGRFENQWWILSGDSELDSGTARIEPEPGTTLDLRVSMTSKRFGDVRFLRLVYRDRKLPGFKTELLAHRGAASRANSLDSNLFPANTMHAFSEALLNGYEGFELDVRVTRDRKFIVAHDEGLETATSCTGNVRDKDLSELLKCSATGSTVIPEFVAVESRYRSQLVSLKTVLNRYLSSPWLKHIIVDVKPDDRVDLVGATQDALQGIHDPKLLSKLVFIARDLGVVRKLKLKWPSIAFALEGTLGTEPITNTKRYLPRIDPRSTPGHDVVSLNIGLLYPLPEEVVGGFVTEAKRRGYGMLGWTLTEEEPLRHAFRTFPGLDYLLTDSAYCLLAKLQLERWAR